MTTDIDIRSARSATSLGTDLQVAPMQSEHFAAAVRLLARAYVTNPLHIAAFGRDALARNEMFFQEALSVMRGTMVVALDGTTVVGFAHWVRSPQCQLSLVAKLRLMPTMLHGFGPPSAFRLTRWLSAWSTHDPDIEHLHLGPIAVEPQVQRQGIGTVLMQRYCAELDGAQLAGHLETDRATNVTFYERFGFVTVREAEVIGTNNHFMWRAQRAS